MTKKKRISKKKIIKFILVLILLLFIVFGAYQVITGMKDKKKVKQQVKVEEKIDDYGYELEDNETEYYKSLFKELKAVLNEKELDEEKYASLISQLFLTDFFTLDNKLSKNDIGGLQFVYSDFQTDFEKLAKESVYRYIESNIYGDRKQSLPIVKEVSVTNIENASFNYLDQTDEHAYQVDLKISYEEDMGYQEDATLVLIHNNDRLEIIKMTK